MSEIFNHKMRKGSHYGSLPFLLKSKCIHKLKLNVHSCSALYTCSQDLMSTDNLHDNNLENKIDQLVERCQKFSEYSHRNYSQEHFSSLFALNRCRDILPENSLYPCLSKSFNNLSTNLSCYESNVSERAADNKRCEAKLDQGENRLCDVLTVTEDSNQVLSNISFSDNDSMTSSTHTFSPVSPHSQFFDVLPGSRRLRADNSDDEYSVGERDASNDECSDDCINSVQSENSDEEFTSNIDVPRISNTELVENIELDTASSSDGEEKIELDADQDKKNPAYVPRTGRYFMHDSRDEQGDSIDNKIAEKKGRGAQRWEHDKFSYYNQAPKSARELIKKYGYDIRQNKEAQEDVADESAEKPASIISSNHELKRNRGNTPRAFNSGTKRMHYRRIGNRFSQSDNENYSKSNAIVPNAIKYRTDEPRDRNNVQKHANLNQRQFNVSGDSFLDDDNIYNQANTKSQAASQNNHQRLGNNSAIFIPEHHTKRYSHLRNQGSNNRSHLAHPSNPRRENHAGNLTSVRPEFHSKDSPGDAVKQNMNYHTISHPKRGYFPRSTGRASRNMGSALVFHRKTSMEMPETNENFPSLSMQAGCVSQGGKQLQQEEYSTHPMSIRNSESFGFSFSSQQFL